MQNTAAHLLISTLVLVAILPLGAAYKARYRSNGAWYYGSTTAFVGQDNYRWDWEHEPTGWYNVSGGATMIERWDFEGITCSAATDLCSKAGFQLPNGVQVRLATTGILPAPLIPSWGTASIRRQVYYVVNSTPATNNNDAIGSFSLAHTPDGPPIDLTDNGTGTTKLSFAGYTHVLLLEVKVYLNAVLNPGTDIITTVEPDGVTPKVHGFTNSTAVYFMRGSGTILPTAYGQPVETHGSAGHYCAVVLSSTTLRLRLMANEDSNCPTNNIAPANTGTANCDTTGKCVITSGTYWQQNMAFRWNSFTSGSPSNVSVGSPYWSTSVSPSSSFKFTNFLPLQQDKIEPDQAFSGEWEVLTTDFADAGSNLMITSSVQGAGSSYYVRSVTGYPQGTVFSWRHHATIKSGPAVNSSAGYDRYGSLEMTGGFGTMIAKVPAVSTPGDATVSITLGPGAYGAPTDPQTFQFSLHKVTLTPLPKAHPAPSSFTAIPNLAQWEELMTSTSPGSSFTDFGGRSYGCSSPSRQSFQATKQRQEIDSGGIYGYGVLTQDPRAQFYDGTANWYYVLGYEIPADVPQALDKYNARNCADYLADYEARYLNGTPTAQACCAVSGVRGLYQAYGRFFNVPAAPQGDRGYLFKQALLRVAQIGGNATGKSHDLRMREASWQANYWHKQYKLTGHLQPYYRDQIETIIGWMYAHGAGQEGAYYIEPFMIGLMERALTDYYREVYRDERIPVVIKLLYDKFWNEWYDPATHQPYYMPYPYGERCSIGCAKYTCPILNSFLSAGYWFIWRLTGDNTYRDRGDELFATMYVKPAGTGCSGVPYTMKEWNQTMFRNGDGVEWRTGRANPW